MAIGYRWPRHGNALDRVRRAAFHGLVKFVTGARLRDLGCGARAMRRQVLEEIDLYGDQHRFLPILAMRLGFRVSEIPLRQSAQDRHGRIYRPREYMHHLLDLFSIFFLMRFTKKPLRFFGMLGAATFGVGAVLIAYLGVRSAAVQRAAGRSPRAAAGGAAARARHADIRARPARRAHHLHARARAEGLPRRRDHSVPGRRRGVRFRERFRCRSSRPRARRCAPPPRPSSPPESPLFSVSVTPSRIRAGSRSGCAVA